MRQCKLCGVERSLSDFQIVKSIKAGVTYYHHRRQCKSCRGALVEKWQKEHPDRIRAHTRKYEASVVKDPIKRRQYALTRRAREHGASGSFTATQWRTIVAAQASRCFDCGVFCRLTVGHLVPLSRGGEHDASNIVGQCKSCNSRQGARIHPAAVRGQAVA